MKRFSNGFLLVGVLGSASLLSAASAQQQTAETGQESSDSKKTTRVTLGSASATPGTSVVIPIYFTPGEGMRVGD